MSTAGKVLIPIITVTLLGWLILLAMVAQLNDNWGATIAKQTADLENLRKDFEATRDQLAQAKSSLAREQVNREHDVVVHRARVADGERSLTDTIESLERVTAQVEEQQEAQRVAELGRKRRIDEQEQTRQELAAAREDVEQLKGSYEMLAAQLDQLRAEFQELLQENRRLIGSSAE